MVSRRTTLISASVLAVLVGGGVLTYQLIAAQGQGTLSQVPLNNQVQAQPAFIMTVDNSGSMTFQTQFPGADGQACWNTSAKSFFSSTKTLSTTGTCAFYYVLPGTRISGAYYGIAPFDKFGFARSPTYNPAFYNPTIKYEPWMRYDTNQEKVVDYAQAATSKTLIDPRLAANAANTVDLTAATTGVFNMVDGMVVPQGTVFAANGKDGTPYAANKDYTWKTTDFYVAGRNQTQPTRYDATFTYVPATFFLPFTGKSDPVPELAGSPGAYTAVARTEAANACGTGCTMWKYTIKSTDGVALQNFANWFSYYGNRNRSMIAGMTRSMATVDNLRVGYFKINDNADYDMSDKGAALPIRDLGTKDDKRALYADMIALNASGSTPNRQAVKAAATQFTRTDDQAPVQLACQKNAVMLFTDGYSNLDGPEVANANGDGNMGIPFKDSHDNTMADIAASYYINKDGKSPLRPELAPGLVPVPEACNTANPDPRLDCQKNLHVNFYGITLGGRGKLFNPDIVQDPYTNASIYNNWPKRENGAISTIDDIWHAAVNTRGEFINARTPADITQAMRRVLSSVTAGASSSGSYAQSGARIGTGSMAVAPYYEIANESTDWFSRLTASQITVDQATRKAVYTTAWEASAKMPQPTARKVFFGTNTDVLPFSSNSVTLESLCDLSPSLYPGMARCSAGELTDLGATRANAVSYLLGERSLETRRGGRFRDRTTVLGDIINSSPVISAPIDDYGYRGLDQGLGASYATYLETKRSGRYMVYVGANDGMLHAFDGGMGVSGTMDSSGGAETFAYIPATSMGHMGNLLFPLDPNNQAFQKFSHRYYVDGPVAVSDARIGTSWGTVLVGSTGAGGRGVFALDVTKPGSFGTGSRLWEINDLSGSEGVKANIGHVLGKPVIVPFKDASGTVTWKAIFGNGYGSASGKVVLFMVDIGTGSPNITMIEASETAGSPPAGKNGLGNILVVDRWTGSGRNARGRDGYADTVYAADQKGAVWKFDLRDTSARVSTPLFTTQTSTRNGLTYRQPITGGINATNGDRGGVMLFFGTGSFVFNEDVRDESIQSLYAVLDASDEMPSLTMTAADLRPYTVSASGDVRTMTPGTIPADSRGWHVDLPAGERFLAYPALASGVVFMPTYVPNPTTKSCASDGSNWLFGLSAQSGAPALSKMRAGSPTGTKFGAGTAAVPLSTGGNAPVKDVGVQVLPRQQPPGKISGDSPGGGGPGSPGGTPPPVDPPAEPCQMLVTAAGGVPMYVPYPCGRQSWRQLQ